MFSYISLLSLYEIQLRFLSKKRIHSLKSNVLFLFTTRTTTTNLKCCDIQSIIAVRMFSSFNILFFLLLLLLLLLFVLFYCSLFIFLFFCWAPQFQVHHRDSLANWLVLAYNWYPRGACLMSFYDWILFMFVCVCVCVCGVLLVLLLLLLLFILNYFVFSGLQSLLKVSYTYSRRM